MKEIRISHILADTVQDGVSLCIKPGEFCLFDDAISSNARHVHNCYELCLVTAGNGIFHHGEESYVVGKGDVFIADPGVVHEISLGDQPGQHSLQLFYFSIRTEISHQQSEGLLSSFLQHHHQIRSNQTHLLLHLEFICKYAANRNASKRFLEQAIIQMVLDSLYSLTKRTRGAMSASSALPNVVDTAMQYITDHLTERIVLDEMAHQVGSSKRNLQLLFARHLNCTISEFINMRRSSLAASYMRMNFPIGSISRKVGIGDAGQLCRIFKRYYGLSPKQYQLQFLSSGMQYGAEFKQ